MRFSLRILLFLLGLVPPLLAGVWTTSTQALANYHARHRVIEWEEVGGPGMIESYAGPMCNLIFEAGEDDE